MTRYLDPRLSEVAVQVLRPSDSQIVSMLPSLLDDPDKTSAWTASQSIRVFVYSLLLRMDDDYKDMTLVEFNDRTQPNTKGRFLDLLDERSLIRTASRLLSMLNSIREFLGRAQCSVTYWQTVCYIQVIYHNLALTPGMMKHLSGLLRKMSNGELSKMGWSEIHFQAQFEGTYYAFRQLYQTLYYLFPADDLAKLKSLSELKRTMVDFPSISEMFVGQSQVIAAEVDAKYVLDSASEMLDNQVDSDGPTLSQ